MKIIIATAKAPHNRRVDFAMSTWTGADEVIEIECARSSKDLGDERGCYFFKDVFDYALKLNDEDIFVYVNNDVALMPEWKDHVIPAVLMRKSAGSSRVEVNNFESPERGTTTFGGKDVFAFSADWWRQVRDSLPDVLLGYECYDFVVFKTMLKTGGKEITPICYHEKHFPVWRAVTLDHPVRIRERALFEKWMDEQITERYDEDWVFDYDHYRPYGYVPGVVTRSLSPFAGTPLPSRSTNLSTSAGDMRKNLSTSAELFS